MKNKFTLGVIAGMSSLALAVPIIAQVSSAASAPTESGATNTAFSPRVIPGSTQQSVQDLIARDNAFLANIDAMVTIQKNVAQTHIAALTAAASITDETQREAAVKTADQAERATVQNAITANAGLKSAMMPFGFGGRGGSGHDGPNSAELAAKLGMTETELKAALAGGKTIQQIATEKGVTLPASPMGFRHGPRNDMLAQKLGMTEAELQTALDSGKTIQQIAAEKGVTLPTRPSKGTATNQTSSAQ